ncbi:MAG: hypothetical protein EZS28_042733, partial [Streblomastix strix]
MDGNALDIMHGVIYICWTGSLPGRRISPCSILIRIVIFGVSMITNRQIALSLVMKKKEQSFHIKE